MSVRSVSDATFDAEVKANSKPVLVDFWAEWCGPCRKIAPVLDQIAAEHAEQIDVVKVDIDANPRVAGEYGIMSVPTLVVIADGEEVDRLVGAKPKSVIENAVLTPRR